MSNEVKPMPDMGANANIENFNKRGAGKNQGKVSHAGGSILSASSIAFHHCPKPLQSSDVQKVSHQKKHGSFEHITSEGAVSYEQTYKNHAWKELTVEHVVEAVKTTSSFFDRQVKPRNLIKTSDNEALIVPVSTLDGRKKINATVLFDAQHSLGQGGIGYVFAGRLIEKQKDGNFTMRDVAVKVGKLPNVLSFSEKFQSKRREDSAFLESKSFAYGYVDKRGHECVVKDICHNGDAKRYNFKSAQTIAKMLLGVAIGLNVMKHQGFVHRDIKPGNILVDEDGYGVVVDFACKDTDVQGKKPAGTRGYFSRLEAPKGQDSTGDMFAFRVTTEEILEKYNAKLGKNNTSMSLKEANALYALRQLASELKVSRNKRPTASKVAGWLLDIACEETIQELKDRGEMSPF